MHKLLYPTPKVLSLPTKMNFVCVGPSQLAEEFSFQVTETVVSQLDRLLVERWHETSGLGRKIIRSEYCEQSLLPVTTEEWLDYLRSRLVKSKQSKQAGLDILPDDFYRASGQIGLQLLAPILARARQHGPPMSWRGGLMWAGPREPHLPLSPLNSRTFLRADHKAKNYSAAIGAAILPVS